MTKVVTSIHAMTAPEGVRVGYTYSEISEAGEILTRHNQGYFLAVNKAELDAVRTLTDAASARLLSDNAGEVQTDGNA